MGVGLSGILQKLYGAGTDEELYGKKVKVPDYPGLDKAQREAVAANKAILPDATGLATSVDTFNQQELERMLEMALPDYASIKKNTSSSIEAMSRGALPPDVEALIQRKTAERGVTSGFKGSGMGRNLTARDMGLTSLDLTQRGLTSFERWVNVTKAPRFDVTSQFVSPAQQFAANDAKFQRDLYAAQMEAAPDPAKRGAWDTQMDLIGQILAIYSGGSGGYKGTYHPENTGAKEGGGGGRSYTLRDTYSAASESNYDAAVGQAAGRLY